jgi:hypothetical protein
MTERLFEHAIFEKARGFMASLELFCSPDLLGFIGLTEWIVERKTTHTTHKRSM